MTDDEVLAAVDELVRGDPERAISVGEVVDHLGVQDVDEVAMHLEQLREAGRLFRSIATDSDHPPAVLTYTPYETAP